MSVMCSLYFCSVIYLSNKNFYETRSKNLVYSINAYACKL